MERPRIPSNPRLDYQIPHANWYGGHRVKTTDIPGEVDKEILLVTCEKV